MTDEEIVKALECLIKDGVYYGGVVHLEDVLDLIQRQKDIIQKQCDFVERLEADYGKLVEKNAELNEERENMEREIFVLEEDNRRLKGYIDFKTANVMCDKCKEQAVKDTAREIYDWLKEHTFDGAGWELVKTYFREKGVEVE